MSGHQPTLFHPGVWFKNFALSKLGKQEKATPINLVIDNDVAVGSTIRVPVSDPSSGKAKYETVDFDIRGGGIPYEQSELSDLARFESFATRATACIRPLVETPCVNPLWMHARAASQRSQNTGTILAEARHSLETHCNLETLEVPLSQICESETFFAFALMIMEELPRFHQCYNESVEDYRVAHRIRSSSHPVPNLQNKDDWLEAPFWIYGTANPNRRAAWIRKTGHRLVISDGGSEERSISVTEASKSGDVLGAIVDHQFKIRPRALTTTMYARIILSDLFLHGIGGGKYDQLSDQIMRRFFQIQPPAFTVISATATLPNINQPNSDPDITELQRLIRDTVYQPENFAEETNLPETLVKQKQVLLRQIPEKGHRKQWHRELESINDQLASHLAAKRVMLRDELDLRQTRNQSARILRNREHAYCLFDLNYLNQTFESMLL